MALAIPRHNVNFTPKECLFVFGSILKKPSCTNAITEFETAFAKYLGIAECISFSSGSAALFHGLRCSGLSDGDKIILPDYEFVTVIETIRMCGLEPVFAKTDKNTGNLTLDAIEKVYDSQVKAVLIAHIHGQPAKIDPVARWCNNRNLTLIEDCAHAAGAKTGEKKAGTFGRFSIFSFGPGKSLTTCGGGMVATSDDALAEKLRKNQKEQPLPDMSYERKRMISTLVKWLLSTRILFSFLMFPFLFLVALITGRNPLDKAFVPGTGKKNYTPKEYDFRFTDSAANLGNSQLKRLDDLNEKRTRNAEKIIEDLQDNRGVQPFSFEKERKNVFLNCAVRVDDGDLFSLGMLKQGIDVRRDYLLYYSKEFPEGRVPQDTIYLPNHPGIRFEEIDRIVRAVKRVYKKTK